MKLEKLYSNYIWIGPGLINESILLNESENTTLILDFDETLAHVVPVTSRIIELLKNQSDEIPYTHESDAIVSNQHELMEALKQYKYKDLIVPINHPNMGLSIIVYRPNIKQFFDTLDILKEKELIRNYVLFTANQQNVATLYAKTTSKYIGRELPVYLGQGTPYDPHASVVIDDSKPLGSMKYSRSTGGSMGDARVIGVERFKGNMNDDGFAKVIKQLKSYL